MQQFQENIRIIFGEKHLNILNLNYLYEEIGYDLNDLCESFRNWTYNETDLKTKSEYIYLSNKTDLYKKLLSFGEVFSKKNSYVCYCSMDQIVCMLMPIIAKKADGPCVVFPDLWIDEKHNDFPPMYVFGSDYIYKCSLNADLYDIVNMWKGLVQKQNVRENAYGRIFIKDIDHFLTLPNEKMCEHLLRFLFFDECLCMNLEYLGEELSAYFDSYLNKIKKIVERVRDMNLSTKVYKTFYGDTCYDLSHEFSENYIDFQYSYRTIFNKAIGHADILILVIVFLSSYLKVSLHVNNFNSVTCLYEKKTVLLFK